MKISTLIVDDETLSRRGIEIRLAAAGDFEIVAQCTCGREALAAIQLYKPDLVFLDIQMPAMSGFEVLAQLPQACLPVVVFVTAYDQYAIRAFEARAVDYLLKPIDPARLAEALTRIKSAHAERKLRPDDVLEQIFVRDGARCWFVPLREVRLLSSEGNYVRLSWGKAQPLLGRALAALERRLDPNRFFRANRQQIINLDFIENVELGVNGRLHAQLRDGPEVEISRRQARLFKVKMSI